MKNSTLLQLSTVAALIALGVGAWLVSREKTSTNPGVSSAGESSRREGGRKMADNIGAAAKRDASLAQAGKLRVSAVDKAFPVANYGEIKPITAAASPQARSAAEAALSKTHPERLTCAIMPAKFDAKKWATDADYKAQYLRDPEPARCYQSAKPGHDVPRIALASPSYVTTLQSQPVELSVKATPGMPVTFTSFDAASFTAGSGNTGSQLTTQTCVADDDGLATATLLAGPGVINDCRVIASCPVDAGLVRITVHAVLPSVQSPSVAIGASVTNPTSR